MEGKWAHSPTPPGTSFQSSGKIQNKFKMASNEIAFRQLSDHYGAVFGLCFWSSIERGRMLISGSADGTVKTWSLDKDMALNTLKGHNDAVRCVVVSKNDHPSPLIVSGGDDGKIILWSLLSGRLMHTLIGHHGGILALALSKDPKLPTLVSGGHDKAIRFWNVNTGEFMFILQGHERAITGLAISACSSPFLISSSMDRTIRVWDLSTGRPVRKLEGHMGRITCVAVSKDSSSSPVVVSGDSTGACIVWDLRKFKRLFNLIMPSDKALQMAGDTSENGNYPEGTHSGTFGEIASIAISSLSENMVIITSTWGAAVKFWDAKSGGLLRVLDDQRYQSIHRAVICCDSVGPLIAMASADGDIHLSSPEDDYNASCQTITSLRETSIETSLTLVGNYVTYVRLVEDAAQFNADYVRKTKSSNNVMLTMVFYSMIRFAVVNPSFFLANVDVTADILSKIIDLVDLLFVDNFVGITAMQLLLEKRVCVSLSQEWIRIGKNQARVMAFLGDKLQSNDTLDCVLTALVTDSAEGWDVLVSHVDFATIFENLILHSPRSHSKLAYLISKYGLYAEPEPFHIPLAVSEDRDFTVTRLDAIEYSSKGVHCYRVMIQDRLPAEFFMTHKFLDALVSSDSVEALVATPLINYVLQYRWDTWGYYVTGWLGILHIFYCLSAMSAVFCICSEEYDSCRVQPVHAISVLVVVLINTLYMGLSILQFSMSPDIWSFCTSFWKMAEVVMIGLCHVCILLGTAMGPSFAIRQVCAVFALFLWAWLPYFGRGSVGLAGLLHQMRIIIFEVRYFVGILALFNGAFAVAFRILDIYDSVWYAAIRCFNMMLGDIHFDYISGHTFAELLYLVFLISVAIILLNSLIAFMEGSLGSAREKEAIASLISRAQFLAELEVRLLPFNRLAASFRASSEETLQDTLSPSAILTKPGSGGNNKMGKKGVRTGTQNELVVLFPESLGTPVLTTEDADARDNRKFRRRRIRDVYSYNSYSIDKRAQAALTHTSGDREVQEGSKDKYDEHYRDRLEHVELQVSTLDKKLDLILNLLTASSSTPDHSTNNISSIDAENLDCAFGSHHSTPAELGSATHRGRFLFASPAVVDSDGTGLRSQAVPTYGGETSPVSANNNMEGKKISYSYFGSSAEDVPDQTEDV